MMKTIEFETSVSDNGQILLPEDLAGDISLGEPVTMY